MRVSSFLSAVTGLVSILHAQPTTADAPCDPISKYTTEWFLANTKPAYRTQSFDSTALFYSTGLSERAKQFARQAKKHTIWEVWPCEYYWIKDTRANPLQCIMRNPTHEKTYFENMSRAFAMKAHKVATVMHEDIYNPPMDRIWGKVEWPILKASGNPGGIVDYITAIKAGNTAIWDIAWARNQVDRLLEDTQAIHQSLQRIIYPREIEDADAGEMNMEKRDGFDACPIYVKAEVDSSHPLW